MKEDILFNLRKGILVNPDEIDTSRVNIIESFEESNTKKTLKDFLKLYNNRYTVLQGILKQRQDMQGVTAIQKAKTLPDNESATIIGIILDMSKTKNNNIILTLEDPTGTIKAIITKNNKENHQKACNLTPDEIIGIKGQKGKDVIFANSIVLPDVPLNKEFKKSPNNEVAVFISDIHLGSKSFLRKEFETFISWVNTDEKIKYLFVLGDLVEGIGIFPGQEKELEIKDVYEQYSDFSEYIKKINKNIKIIICPGNHDAVRVAEPQPNISRLLPKLKDMKNVSFVSSPSTVNIGQTNNFSGFDILIYHGFSFPFYASTIEDIRLNGGLEKTEEIMEYLLKRRHMAPTHGSTQYQLGFETDPLVIKKVPDFFVSGHIHRCSAKTYKNITLLNCSCWISQTDYQEKRGLVPQPARAIYVNLKTREMKILNFDKEEQEK